MGTKGARHLKIELLEGNRAAEARAESRRPEEPVRAGHCSANGPQARPLGAVGFLRCVGPAQAGPPIAQSAIQCYDVADCWLLIAVVDETAFPPIY